MLKYKKEFYNNEFVPRLRKRASKEWKIENRKKKKEKRKKKKEKKSTMSLVMHGINTNLILMLCDFDHL
ncbi:MAG: hypothetical protein EPS19_00835 [Candidatus Liberibacter solanacearum]|uniref:hypothetical protein n=1 Tax=Candidatus Liberibacter solanacearum TaxID=556287 RepID=UPI000978DA1C|nr:hypothetical protein [Candidatus Liberibacter solanacearum]ONI59102.1 hypothetical protein AYJ09_01605 [Candidatus Liberibacter solanacearum]